MVELVRIPPALKHGAYSATSVLPGESRAAFEKLHRNLKAEWSPSGALEDDIVMTMARLIWRKLEILSALCALPRVLKNHLGCSHASEI